MTDPERIDNPAPASTGESSGPDPEPVPDNPDTFVDDVERIRSEYEDKLQELERLARTARKGHAKTIEPANTFGETSATDRKQMAYGISIAYTIVLLPFAGFGIGWLIDAQVGGTLFQALLTLAMAIAGLAVAVAKLSLLNRKDPTPTEGLKREEAPDKPDEVKTDE